MQTAMHVAPEDNHAAMAAQFAADMIVQRSNAAGLEWTARPPLRLERGQRVEIYHTLSGWTAVMVTRHEDGISSIRQVTL